MIYLEEKGLREKTPAARRLAEVFGMRVLYKKFGIIKKAQPSKKI
jgi:hypothetical protein